MNQIINPRQKKAIEAPLSPQLVLAGAGSGKTFVLTKRISYLINHYKISPSRIWAITFTNKASLEIQERVKKECQYAPNHIATFHKSCIWILRKHIHLLNRESNFRIIDEIEQKSLLRRIYKTLNLGFDFLLKPQRSLALISFFKNNNYKFNDIDYHVFTKYSEGINDDKIFKSFKLIYTYYVKFLSKENLLDFDDILLLTNQLFKFPEVLEYWQDRFDAVLIDEFQDTNEIQFNIVSAVAKKHQNIFAVGDPDQSIYGWRGASPEITQDFIKCFQKTEITLLEQNYRSTQKILNVSNCLIKNNSNRIEKNLFTQNENGTDIFSYIGFNEKDEANWISEQILKLQNEQNIDLKKVLVLYRSNYLTKALEEAFLEYDIPYRIFGGVKFYQRAEIKNIVSYINLIISDDPLAIERVYNTPSRKISEATFEKIHQFAIAQNITLLKAFQKAELILGITSIGIKGAHNFFETVKKLRTISTQNFHNLVSEVFEISGYKKSLDPQIDAFRFENIKWFQDSLGQIQNDNPEKTLEDVLSEIALYSEADEQINQINDNKKINLMTIHNAKGLEYDYVFVSNLCEGIFPSKRSVYDFEKVEEERRIAYVAFTRAKKQLFLTASNGYDFIWKKSRTQSRFLKEVEKLQDLKHYERKAQSNYKFRDETNSFYDSKVSIAKKASENYLKEKPNYKIGQNVVHKTFGPGTIIAVGTLGKIPLLKIAFKSRSEPIEIVATHKGLTYLLH